LEGVINVKYEKPWTAIPIGPHECCCLERVTSIFEKSKDVLTQIIRPPPFLCKEAGLYVLHDNVGWAAGTWMLDVTPGCRGE